MGDVHLLQQLLGEETILAAFERVPPARVVPGRRAQGALAVDEDVVLRAVVVSAMGEDGAEGAPAGLAAAEEHVAEHRVAAVAVVEVDGGVAVAHRAADVVPVVEADQVAAARRVAPLVESAAVVGFGADVVDLVEFEHMVVAADEDGLVRRIVDQVVRGPVADALEREAVGRSELVLGEAPDVVVDGLVAGRA